MSTHHLAVDLTPRGRAVRLAYLDRAGETEEQGTILLIHGFPQTSYQFRHVLPLLSQAGFRCIAPDYRGAGRSSKPENGFTKAEMATDLVVLLDHLDITTPVHVVGHDIGGMIAFAMARMFPDRVRSVCWGECPLPGTAAYYADRTEHAVQQFHFIFHSVPDLPEALIAGKEGIYVEHFLTKICHNVDAFPPEAVDHYAAAYAQLGAMRCALSVYRAFEEDARENQKWISEHGKCAVPTLILNGEYSRHEGAAESMAMEVIQQGSLEIGVVASCAHYLAEEHPANFVDLVLRFIQKHT
ncbi:hypothetical protein AMS68_004947 [Peltaster fructicola]|uniref:AB hydrolase-1 domain-containing protein n=1 Tax=Peltaster fructicola TaxID=286661 RepID=A0A6H0XYD6_9PEZI|nr:hypothetical protein AMS68_004947 [Peltaster fructicola]